MLTVSVVESAQHCNGLSSSKFFRALSQYTHTLFGNRRLRFEMDSRSGYHTLSSTHNAIMLRDNLCMGRVEVAHERERFKVCCQTAEGSIIGLKEVLDDSIGGDIISHPKKMEFERLRSQLNADVSELVKQQQRTREAESKVKNCEAQLSDMGYWVVGLPNPPRL